MSLWCRWRCRALIARVKAKALEEEDGQMHSGDLSAYGWRHQDMGMWSKRGRCRVREADDISGVLRETRRWPRHWRMRPYEP